MRLMKYINNIIFYVTIHDYENDTLFKCTLCSLHVIFFRSSGLPFDIVQWDLCNLPMRSSSVDIIITDMPFGKRYWQKSEVVELFLFIIAINNPYSIIILLSVYVFKLFVLCMFWRMGSKKKNWELYPLCLREMARVCKPGTGKAVLLTQDKKCFSKVWLLPFFSFFKIIIYNS